MIARALDGASYLIRGFQLLGRPGLRRFLLVPLAVNTLLFAGGFALLSRWFDAWLQSSLAALPDWLDWLAWLAWPLFVLAFLVAGFFTFTLLANLLALPFNGLLARAVGHRLGWTGEAESPFSLRLILADLGIELRRLLRFLGWSLLIGLLFLVPGLGLLAAPLWLALSAWMLAEEYADPALETHGLVGAARDRALSTDRATWFGFGAAALAATLIPVVNFAVMPAAVAGAMALFTERSTGS